LTLSTFKENFEAASRPQTLAAFVMLLIREMRLVVFSLRQKLLETRATA
jgi:hypothetical protein